MTPSELVEILERQVARIRRNGGRPAEIRVGSEYMPVLLSDTATITFIHNGADGGIGIWRAWKIMTGRPGEIRVIPEDWPGYGQGAVRPIA